MAFNQQQLETDQVFEAKSSLTTLLTDLDQIANLGELLKARRRKRAKLGGFIILGGLFAIVAGIIVFNPLAIVGVLVILLGLGVLISASYLGGKVPENPTRINVARQRMVLILDDASNTAPFSLKLGLSANPKLATGPGGIKSTGTQAFSEDSWFSLEGPLLDGTVLTDEIKELIRVRSRRNARGKTKTKVRTQHLITVRYSYPRESYGDARAAGQALQNEARVPHGATLHSVRVTEKAVALKAMATSNNAIIPTLGALSLGGYRILNLARRMAAAQRR
jgi:hypothetical protein